PSFVEGRPIFSERCMSGIKPGPQLLRVDRAQVLAGARAQRTLEPNQITCRTLALLGGLRGPHGRSDDVLPLRRRWRRASITRLCISRGTLELRLVWRAARKPTPRGPDLPILEELSRVHLGCLHLRKTLATRRRMRYRRQREEHQNCQKGSRRRAPR